jgi:hypothetical protein
MRRIDQFLVTLINFQDDALMNAKLVMKTAEKLLQIPMIIDPEDFLDQDRDEQVFLTYLMYFKSKVGSSLLCLSLLSPLSSFLFPLSSLLSPLSLSPLSSPSPPSLSFPFYFPLLTLF